MIRLFFIVFTFILIVSISSCSSNTKPGYDGEARIISHTETIVLRHPDWSRNAVMYEVNIRQHTTEGTFAAFEKDIPRLKEMGIDVLWLMPIHPIGEKNRKGSLGNPYSVQAYVDVNTEYGTMDDFKHMVKAIHESGMKIIIDWVANCSAFDNEWVQTHKEYYLLDSVGNPQPPLGVDSIDFAQFDWEQKELWRAMKEAMKFWVAECDVDGYRCEAAMNVPILFWEETRASLDSIKPVFMLAEAEQKDHHLKAFDMSYASEFAELINELAKGNKKLSDIDLYMARQDTAFQRSAYRMYFTTNHRENSGQGTGNERFGNARLVYDVLCFTIAGMPLMYTSQEGGEQFPDGRPNRLSIYEKDTVYWNDYKYQDFYARLLNAHHDHPALWNGEFGGSFKRIKTSSDELIYAFIRKKDNSEVITLLNFSDKPQRVNFLESISGEYKSIFNNQTLTVFTEGNVKLGAYGYQVFVK